MNRTRSVVALALALSIAAAHSIGADVRSEERTLVKFEGMLGRVVGIFGGKAAREGVRATTTVQGDRKATVNDATGQIVDLAEEKIYDLDIRRKTYKVTTFAELRRQMEEARKKAEENVRQARKEEPGAETAPPDKPVELEVDFDVKETGQTKAINGFNTRQVVLTVTLREKGRTLEQSGGMVLTTDMWLAPSIAALAEIAAFDLRYAKQLAGPMLTGASMQEMAAAMAAYPGLQEGLAKMRAESAKMDGTAIATTMTVDAVKSAEAMAAEKQAAADSRPSTPTSVGGLVGGLARRAARREPEAPSPRATFMTSTHEVLRVATTVNPADVALPAGFKETK
jgi:hypothetical protein